MRERTNPACSSHRHGTYSDYRIGCRCPEAREDQRLYQKRIRERRALPRLVDRTGTVRRLQALAALGWRWQDMAEALGKTSWQNVQAMAIGKSHRLVTRATAAGVARIYGRLSGHLGPSEVTRRRAVAKGWAPPLAWDDIDDPDATPRGLVRERRPTVDQAAVERVLSGDRLKLDGATRVEVVRRAAAMWMSDARIAELLGVTRRSVVRIRHRNGIEAGQGFGSNQYGRAA